MCLEVKVLLYVFVFLASFIRGSLDFAFAENCHDAIAATCTVPPQVCFTLCNNGINTHFSTQYASEVRVLSRGYDTSVETTVWTCMKCYTTEH